MQTRAHAVLLANNTFDQQVEYLLLFLQSITALQLILVVMSNPR